MGLVKNRKQIVKRPKIGAIAKLFLSGAIVLNIFTSCQSPSGGLNPENPTYTIEKSYQNANIEQHKNIYDYEKYDKEVKLDLQYNHVFFNIDRELYEEHDKEFDWCYKYISDLFATIAPEIRVVKRVVEDISRYDKRVVSSTIFFTQQDIQNASYLGRNDKKCIKTEDGLAISKNVIVLNKRFKEAFYQSTYFKNVILHEVLHAFGLSHINTFEGGNILTPTIESDYHPLAISPVELHEMLSKYSTKDEEFNNSFLQWYINEYSDSLDLVTELKRLHKNVTNEPEDELIESTTIIFSDYNKTLLEENHL